jgi:hypothetical protein
MLCWENIWRQLYCLYTWNCCESTEYEALANDRGAAVDGGDHKRERAIDVAARAAFVSVVQALLENGANTNTQTNNGRCWYAHCFTYADLSPLM